MEYQLWLEDDPHARSWRTICSDESVAIMRRLRIIDGDQIVDPVGFDNCLSCHNSTRRYNEPRTKLHAARRHATHLVTGQSAGCQCAQSDSATGNSATGDSATTRDSATTAVTRVASFLREGVGCSSCHGPSQHWVGVHFQHGWSPRLQADQGFVQVDNLYVRARVCASCHVGDRDRDMNHDIIAAGHPTLRFELATYHSWLPKHWRDIEANDKTYYEAQLWLAGQIAATDAFLALLQTRSGDLHSVSEWPELAAFDCASCHHDLGLDNARSPLPHNRDAAAIYSSWHDAGLRWLIEFRIESGQAVQEDWQLLACLERVRQQMQVGPQPRRDQVSRAAAEARAALAEWFDGRPGQHERTMFRSHRLGHLVASAAGKYDSFQTWESAVQFYLAAIAARESWPGGWQGPIRSVADQLQRRLRYPDMIDVSRYAKRHGNRPTATPAQTRQLGIELAGFLGAVPQETADQTGMRFDFDEDQRATQQLRDQLDRMIEQINERWRETSRRRTADKGRDDQVDNASEEQSERSPKTRQQLLEELRMRRQN